jgi:hypothetical protein
LVEISFTEAGWQDSTGSRPVASTRTFRVEGPQADLAGPLDGGNIDLTEINDRQYLDVTFSPSVGNDLDLSSITDTGAGGAELSL